MPASTIPTRGKFRLHAGFALLKIQRQCKFPPLSGSQDLVNFTPRMKISASVYSSDAQLEKVVHDLDALGIDYLHIDCNDDPGVFADIERIRNWSKTPVDLHIISGDPSQYFESIRKHPPELLTIQYENLLGPLSIPEDFRFRLGLAITSETEVEVFRPFADRFDFILLMATNPGRSGGTFNKEIFRKVRQARRDFPGKRIHVDGGVNAEVSFILRNMGVYAAVSGSFLLNSGNPALALLNLKLNNHESHFQVGDFMLPLEETPKLRPGQRSFGQILKSIEDAKMGFTLFVGDDGKLEGMVTNADVRRGLLRNIGKLDSIGAEDLVNTNPFSIREDATVVEMIRSIKAKGFPVNYLPVIDANGILKGSLTFNDLIKGEA